MHITFESYIVKHECSIRDAIRIIDRGGIGFIAIINNSEKVIGVVTDGDFRRAVLKGIPLQSNVNQIANKQFISLTAPVTEKAIINTFINHPNIEVLPILSDGQLHDVIQKSNMQLENKIFLPERLYNRPVVIMAGGKGTRLDPFTRVLPKPLLPIGDKVILEIIMEEYAKYGTRDFYISVNHKGKMIKAFFEEYHGEYSINYINENIPLGTAGAIKLIEDDIQEPFFVSNCDIIIKEDYSTIYDYHIKGNYDLTIVGAVKNYQLPYGVCEIRNGGELKRINEKPEYDYIANTGMYVFNPDVLQYIPEGKEYHATSLIEDLQKHGKKVGVFPVSEDNWIDVGQWNEYNNAIAKLT
jgi:dTDP-glucose pyrophosphorylase